MQKIHVEKAGVYKGHRDSVYALERGLSDTSFFTSGADGMVVSWDMEQPDQGVLVAKVPNSVYAMTFDAGRNELLIGQNFEGIHCIDPLTKEEKKSAQITKAAIFDIKKIKDWVLVASGDGFLIVLDQTDLSTIIKLPLSDKSARCIAVRPDQKQVAVGFSDHTIRILDFPTLRIIKTIHGHTNSVFTVAYSPDGAILLSAGRDAQIKVWETQSYEAVKSIPAHMYAINHICYSPSGQYFASASMDKSIKVWDAAEFRLLKVIDKSRHAGHGTSVNKLWWTPFQQRLVSVSDDRTVSLWDLFLTNEH